MKSGSNEHPKFATPCLLDYVLLFISRKAASRTSSGMPSALLSPPRGLAGARSVEPPCASVPWDTEGALHGQPSHRRRPGTPSERTCRGLQAWREEVPEPPRTARPASVTPDGHLEGKRDRSFGPPLAGPVASRDAGIGWECLGARSPVGDAGRPLGSRAGPAGAARGRGERGRPEAAGRAGGRSRAAGRAPWRSPGARPRCAHAAPVGPSSTGPQRCGGRSCTEDPCVLTDARDLVEFLRAGH